MRSSYYVVLLALVVFGNLSAINSLAKLSKIENERLDLNSEFRGNGLHFTPNKGQVADCYGNFAPDVIYKCEGGTADVYLRKTGVSYIHSNMDQLMHKAEEHEENLEKDAHNSKRNLGERAEELEEKYVLKIHRVDMNFDGCNRGVITINEDEIEGYSNYYYPHCPKGVTGIKKYSKVTCKNIYDNIDVTYFGNVEGGLKYNINVNPGANSDQVRLHWVGAEELLIVDGKLRIKTSINEFYESIPKVYQNINGKMVDLRARYTLRRISKGEAVIGFSIDNYNLAFPLVIDPWVTYFGPSRTDGRAITTDNTGNSTTTGSTNSLLLPVSAGAFQTSLAGGFLADAFIVKFNPSGIMLWSTYYGGSNSEDARGIAADSFGNIVITGQTSSSNFPVTGAAFQSTLGTAQGKAFVVKFNSAGIRQWATYYGGTFYPFPGFGNQPGNSVGNAVAIDSNGDIVFTGNTSCNDFPVTIGAAQLTKGGVNNTNAFVVKLDGAGLQMWSSYYGGSGTYDTGNGIAVDNNRNVLVSGTTNSTNFPVVSGIQMAMLGVGDAFLLKFNATGSVLWATYFGGSGYEQGQGVCFDSSNNIIITGTTNSVNFPVLNAQQPVYGGNSGDAFLAKLNPLGLIIWSTYLGGSAIEYGYGVATDFLQNVYVYGDFEDFGAGNYPISSCAYQSTFGGGPGNGFNEDQFIAKYDPNGIQRCITYMGGSTEDDGENPGAIAVYGNVLYITGSSAGNYPVTNGAYQTVFSGTYSNGFIDQLCINLCEVPTLIFEYTASTNKACPNTPIVFTPTVSNSCDTTGYRFHWTFTGGTPTSSDFVKPTVTFSDIGTHDVKLVLTTVCKKDSLIKPNYIDIQSITGQFTKGTTTCAACGCKEWILVSAIGGAAPYSYSWPNGNINRYQNKLCPGIYTINIKDKNGCGANVSVTAP